ncbi:MAG TPA: HdeD family acid-resistance protein, partial [Stellaceae bacterium]|nr:HdeD family acid-resistance protein [Stellaceae bacterium]
TGWGWFVALGVLMILLGAFAWFDIIALTLAGTIYIGAALLVGGAFQIGHAFMDRSWSGFLLQVLAGILYGIGGILIMWEPVAGSIVITLVLAILMIVAGCFRVALAIRHWHLGGAGMLLLGGLVSIGVGVALYITLPWSGLWVLGTLIALELIIHGAAWLEFGLGLRRLV